MPLTLAEMGIPQVIKKIGGKDETKRFLENLGFAAEKGGMAWQVVK